MPKVIELRNPRALMVKDVQDLILRAVATVEFITPGNQAAAAYEMVQYVTDDKFFLLLGVEEGAPKGVLLGYFPTSHLFPFPVVSLIYNEGTRALGKELVQASIDTITSNGYSKGWAINGSGRSDKAWVRCLVPDGIYTKPIGTLMEVGVT